MMETVAITFQSVKSCGVDWYARRMARVEVEREWSGGGEDSERALEAVAARHGLRVKARGDTWELEGGSQIRMRLLGGWFIKAGALPKRGRVTRAGEGMALHLEDAMGVGVMDPKLRSKYERILVEIAADFERELSRG